MPRALVIVCVMLGSCLGAPAEPRPDAPAEPKLIVEASPAPEAEPIIEPSGFTPATAGKGDCKVTVSELLEAEEYRGPGPITPAVQASLDADPDYARMYQSESHGDHHIQCVYRVELAHMPGKQFRWRSVVGNTMREATPEICKGMAGEVAEDVIRTTEDCVDLGAGAYWGYVLEPMS